MARPLSEEKRLALLNAATQVLAEHGIASAPTSLIAKRAGVAEGTLFHYFETKDNLFNELYVHIKTNMCLALASKYVEKGGFEARFKSLWTAYIDWGVSHPLENKAVNQLSVSAVISAETKERASALFPDKGIVHDFANHGIFSGDPDYADAIFSAVADTTMTCAARKPKSAEAYKRMGFAALMKMYRSP